MNRLIKVTRFSKYQRETLKSRFRFFVYLGMPRELKKVTKTFLFEEDKERQKEGNFFEEEI